MVSAPGAFQEWSGLPGLAWLTEWIDADGIVSQNTARGERLKEATVEAKRVIDQYRQEKEKSFEDYVKSVRVCAGAGLGCVGLVCGMDKSACDILYYCLVVVLL